MPSFSYHKPPPHYLYSNHILINMGAKRKYDKICSITDCDRPHEAHGLCHRHYKAKRRRDNPKVKEARKEERKKYRQKPENKLKAKCHNTLNRAILKGEIKRQPCEICNEPNAEGHHDDYTKPLEVKWLCEEHHREYHNQ